ncbi:MAG: YCF48-related protein [Myxococcales bacterium]|nr:YCF48-related protein [Myxococcales bacterium]
MLPLLLSALVSGPELEHCELVGLFFTSEREGLIVDACGSEFVTDDGGASWAKRFMSLPLGSDRARLTTSAFLFDGSFLLAGSSGWQVVRSTTNGETWKTLRTTSGQWVYSMSHRGPFVWTCGSDGLILGSADSGQTWKTTKSSATDGDNRCISLSFLDGQRGWVAGWYGVVFETDDGGESWTKLRLPSPFGSTESRVRTIDAVLRFDTRIGWVTGHGGSFRTLDGGETWQPYEADAKTTAVALADGRRLLVTERSARKGPAGWEPVLRITPVARGTSSAWLDGRSVVIEEVGARRIGRLTGPASNDRPREATVRTPFGTTKTAVGQRQGFISEDDGRSWRELSALPGDEVFEELAFLNQRTAIARAASGALFRSEDEGAHWKQSVNLELDASDLATAKGASADAALACLKNPSGSLTLEFGVHGCFGGSANSLELTWTPAGAEASLKDDHGRADQPALGLDALTARQRLTALRERALRPERPSSCISTNQYVVSLEVSCALGTEKRKHTLELTSNDCGQRGGVSADDSYSRAIGVHDWAAAFLPARSMK